MIRSIEFYIRMLKYLRFRRFQQPVPDTTSHPIPYMPRVYKYSQEHRTARQKAKNRGAA